MITVNTIKPVSDEVQLVYFAAEHNGDTYGHHANTPVLEGDELQAHCDANEFKWLNNILYQVYGRNIQFPTLEKWDEWIAAGCKLEEITKTITTPAQPAVDAVMGTRTKTAEESEEVTTTEIVEVDGKMVQREVKETVTKQVPVTKEVPLFNEAGEEIGTHSIDETEKYEISPAIEAVEESSETVVVRAETVVSKIDWKDTTE